MAKLRINITKMAVAAGVGGLDEFLEMQDASATTPRTGFFKTWRDYGRIGMVGIGLAAQAFMPKYAALGETIAVAATPLLMKSIIKMVRKVEYAQPAAVRQLQYRPISRPVSGRVPEFDSTRIF